WGGGHVVRERILGVGGDAGMDVCQRLVESINEATPRRSIQWLWLRDIPDADLRHDLETVNLDDPDLGRRVVWRTRQEGPETDVRYLYAPPPLPGADQAPTP